MPDLVDIMNAAIGRKEQKGTQYGRITAKQGDKAWVDFGGSSQVATIASNVNVNIGQMAMLTRNPKTLKWTVTGVTGRGGPNIAQTVLDESADYTLSSQGTFYDVDSDRLKLVLNTNGNPVLVHFHGNVVPLRSINGTQYAYMDVDIDGTRIGGDDGVRYNAENITTQSHSRAYAMSFTRMVILPPGNHVFKLQWKSYRTSGISMPAGAGTSLKDIHPQFWVWEIGT
jgi:hypothetical protein